MRWIVLYLTVPSAVSVSRESQGSLSQFLGFGSSSTAGGSLPPLHIPVLRADPAASELTTCQKNEINFGGCLGPCKKKLEGSKKCLMYKYEAPFMKEADTDGEGKSIFMMGHYGGAGLVLVLLCCQATFLSFCPSLSPRMPLPPMHHRSSHQPVAA
jgi:hypothetical protein